MKYSVPIVLAYFQSQGIHGVLAEQTFCDGRKWRFDFCWPIERVYLEVNGGIWRRDSHVKGRGAHSRGARMKLDWEKYNTATILGWRPLFCEPKDLMTMKMVKTIRQALK